MIGEKEQQDYERSESKRAQLKEIFQVIDRQRRHVENAMEAQSPIEEEFTLQALVATLDSTARLVNKRIRTIAPPYEVDTSKMFLRTQPEKEGTPQ